MTRGIIIIVALLVVATGCGANGGGASDSGSGDNPSVNWSDYAPQVRNRIDQEAAAADCRGLQQEFDDAESNNDATAARTDHNNADLMTYIDHQMRAAGCYK